MAIHSSILAWKTPTSWTEEHGRLQSLQLQSQTQWNYWACTITLQCCVGFCHTTQWISLKYTYVPSLPNLTTIPYPKKPFNHNTRDDHLYTLVCVCVCVCVHLSGGSEGIESACNEDTRVQFLGWQDPLEKGIMKQSSILA